MDETRWGRPRAWPWLLVLLAAGLAVRAPFLEHESWDYRNYVRPWFEYLRANGVHAFGEEFSNYSPPYLYLLWAATALPFSTLISVKALSVVFDVLLAAAIAHLLLATGSGGRRALAAFGLALLLPTVVLNSAAWGQCDSIYAAFCVFGLAQVLRGRPATGALLAGLGFAFKAQAVFVLPIFLVLVLARAMPWRSLLVLPVPYLAASLVPVAMGRPFVDVLTIYRSQADTYRELTLNAPTLYAWLDVRQGFGEPGMVVAGALTLALCLAAARSARQVTGERVVMLAALFAVAVPFMLPRMHERYFFLADVLTLAYAVLRPSRWFVAVLTVGASFLSYFPFLYGVEVVPLGFSALLVAGALATLLADAFAAEARHAAGTLAALRPVTLGRFACVGAASTLAFIALYGAGRAVFPPLGANALALLVTMAFNFLANRSWTFRSRATSIGFEAPWYVAIYFAGLALSTLTLRALLSLEPAPSPVVEVGLALAAGGVATVTRFAALSLLVYTPARELRPERAPDMP